MIEQAFGRSSAFSLGVEEEVMILDAPLPRPMQLFGPAHRLATSTLLPRRLQHEYGLRCSSLHRLTLPLAARSLKLTAWPILLAVSRLAPPSWATAA